MSDPFDPSPSVLWTLDRDGKTAVCEAVFVPNGVVVRILRSRPFLLSQTFSSGEAALEFAEEEKERMLGSGWGWVVKV